MGLHRLKFNEPMDDKDAAELAESLRMLAEIVKQRAPRTVELAVDRDAVEQSTADGWVGDVTSRLSGIRIEIQW